nr:YkyA family protein [Sporosarcina limicola]
MLFGCSSSSSIEKQLLDVMTKMNTAEKEYRNVQSALTELEKKEQQLFNKTMKITQEQQKDLKTKVTALEKLLDQRLGYLKKEDVAMAKAKEFASDFDAIIDNAAENHKHSIEELQLVIDERYELHSIVMSDYQKLASLQKELYELLIAEGTELKQLNIKLAEVNSQNEIVQASITVYNGMTEKVNVLKDTIFANLENKE